MVTSSRWANCAECDPSPLIEAYVADTDFELVIVSEGGGILPSI